MLCCCNEYNIMNKFIVNPSRYTFNAEDGTITFVDTFTLQNVLLITNVTSNISIYNFACEGLGGDFVINTLTLDFDTSDMDSSDELVVIMQVAATDEDSTIIIDAGSEATLLYTQKIENSLTSIAELLVETNRLLKKIYNPE